MMALPVVDDRASNKSQTQLLNLRAERDKLAAENKRQSAEINNLNQRIQKFLSTSNQEVAVGPQSGFGSDGAAMKRMKAQVNKLENMMKDGEQERSGLKSQLARAEAKAQAMEKILIDKTA